MFAVGQGCEVNLAQWDGGGPSFWVSVLPGFGDVFQGFERKTAMITFLGHYDGDFVVL